MPAAVAVAAADVSADVKPKAGCHGVVQCASKCADDDNECRHACFFEGVAHSVWLLDEFRKCAQIACVQPGEGGSAAPCLDPQAASCQTCQQTAGNTGRPCAAQWQACEDDLP